jgi:hypothetical protein
VRLFAVIAGLVAIATAAWYLWPGDPPPPPRAPAASAPAAPSAPSAAAPRYPIETGSGEPLPALKQSDPTMLEALVGLMGSAAMERFFNSEEIVRRIVATVDNLPRESYATRLNPVKPIGGAFLASGNDDKLVIGDANRVRYAAFVQVAESVDAPKAVALYRHF